MPTRWWTAPMEGESGKTVMVTARDYMDKTIESGKLPYLVRVAWRYNALPDGMPEPADAELMGRVNDAFEEVLRKDKSAVLVAVITGEGQRDWLFHTHSLTIFNKLFNRALADIEETIPFEIEARSDPDWEEYREIRESTYIPESPEES